MHEKFGCIILDWDSAYDLCKDVSLKIKNSGFAPEVIIGVARGGWFFARVLCDLFLLKDLFSLKAEHWGITASITEEAKMKYGLDENAIKKIHGKKVLIADDVTDTGDSIKLAVRYISSLGVKDIKTAMMHHKTSSSFVPDFYGEELKEWKWVIYPWEFHEDVMDLVDRVPVLSKEEGVDLEEIRGYMREEFDIDIPSNRLREVLETMEFHGKIIRKRRKKEGRKEVWVKKNVS